MHARTHTLARLRMRGGAYIGRGRVETQERARASPHRRTPARARAVAVAAVGAQGAAVYACAVVGRPSG